MPKFSSAVDTILRELDAMLESSSEEEEESSCNDSDHDDDQSDDGDKPYDRFASDEMLVKSRAFCDHMKGQLKDRSLGKNVLQFCALVEQWWNKGDLTPPPKRARRDPAQKYCTRSFGAQCEEFYDAVRSKVCRLGGGEPVAEELIMSFFALVETWECTTNYRPFLTTSFLSKLRNFCTHVQSQLNTDGGSLEPEVLRYCELVAQWGGGTVPTTYGTRSFRGQCEDFYDAASTRLNGGNGLEDQWLIPCCELVQSWSQHVTH